MKVFNSQYRITQLFGVDPDYYGQFNLKGHEGIDLVPTGSNRDIFTPVDGVVVKDDDVAGQPLQDVYGVNCTIWWPSLNLAGQYCHLANNTVSEGDRIPADTKIGVMGGTGNVNGDHLHFNLFQVDDNGVRLNKDNGYLGGIDPKPFLESNVVPSDTIPVPRSQFNDFERVKAGWNQVREKLNVEDSVTVVLAEIDKLITYEDKVLDQEKALADASKEIYGLQKRVEGLQIDNDKLKISTNIHEGEIRIQEEKIHSLSTQITELQKNVNIPILTGFKKWVYDTFIR